MKFSEVVSKVVSTLHEDIVSGAVAGTASAIAFGLPVWANFVVAGVVLVGTSFLKNSTVLSAKNVVDVATEVTQTVDAALQQAPTHLP